MAERSARRTLVTPGGTIQFNLAGNVNTFWLTNVSGEDDTEVRIPFENAPVTDGALAYDDYDGPMHPTYEGILYLAPDTSVNQITARNQMEAALRAAIRGLRRGEGTMTVFPTGVDPIVFTVRRETGVSFPGDNPKGFVFGLLVPESPF